METSTGDFSYNISYGSFDTAELAAHIHTSEGGGVVFGLPAGNPKVGVQFGLSEPQRADLLAGLYYVNIHTEAFTGGEIRSQVLQIPEASTAMLLVTGLIGFMGFGRRR